MINGVYLSQLGNNVLTWETAREWNVGLDLGFLDGRVNVTAEYYHKGNRMLMMSITDGCVTIPVICQMVWFK